MHPHVQRSRAFPIVIVGHVDHGKSTLVGRILHDTNSLPDGKLAQLRSVSEKRGLEFEWSFLLDALQVERNQGITVDTTQIWFHTAARRYVIIDAPGHKEFLKNMITGAAQAEAAVLVVDAQQGLAEQTRRHAYLLQLLGLQQVIVAVNKIDLINYDQARFEAVASEIGKYLEEIGLRATAIIPLSAKRGENIVEKSGALEWYRGATLLDALDSLPPRSVSDDMPLRLPVQDVYRIGEKRVIVGRIESGRLKVGARIRFTPGSREAHIASLEAWDGKGGRSEVRSGQSVAFTLDEDVFVERGAVASDIAAAPLASNRLRVRLFWLDATPVRPGERLGLKLGTSDVEAVLDRIEQVIDVERLDLRNSDTVARNEVARVQLRLRKPISADLYAALPRTGRGVLTRGHHVVAGFVIESADATAFDLTAVAASVTPAERAKVNGHWGAVLWLTGLSGAGKSTLAMAAMQELFARGRQVYVLDGDNVRTGLNSDLGFSNEARAENVRRLAEVAKILAESGQIVFVAAISPHRTEREAARRIVGERFREIHVAADLDTCRQRDPKGLYERALRGELTQFTGVSSPYDPPDAPDLRLDTAVLDIPAAARRLVDFADAAAAA